MECGVVIARLTVAVLAQGCHSRESGNPEFLNEELDSASIMDFASSAE